MKSGQVIRVPIEVDVSCHVAGGQFYVSCAGTVLAAVYDYRFENKGLEGPRWAVDVVLAAERVEADSGKIKGLIVRPGAITAELYSCNEPADIERAVGGPLCKLSVLHMDVSLYTVAGPVDTSVPANPLATAIAQFYGAPGLQGELAGTVVICGGVGPRGGLRSLPDSIRDFVAKVSISTLP